MFVVLMGVVLTAGCAAPVRVPARPSAPEAIRLLAALSQRNAGLKTYKGIGDIQVREGNRRFKGAAAWAAAEPNMLRFELLAATGQPILRFAYDGQWVYVHTLDPERFLRRSADEASLERLTQIPVPVADTVSLLAGRPPVRPHDRVEILEAPGEAEVCLVLEQRGEIIEKIYLDPGLDPKRVELFEPGGELVYGVMMANDKPVDGYILPERLVFWNSRQDSLTLSVRRIWANATVAPALFVLEKKASDDS